MWGKEEKSMPPAREVSPPAHTPPPPAERPVEASRDLSSRGGMATVGKSLVIKGQITGGEDLYIDGEVEGTVELKDHSITVGPNGRVNANLHGKDIVVLGRIRGNVRAVDRLEIRKTGSLTGDIVTARVVIEDGAYFKGSIDIQKPGAKSEAPVAAASAAAASGPGPSSSASSQPPTASGSFSLSGGDVKRV
jgi:cytoskeletal protein CcmA (bactofilin family)